ncbi:MAG: DUF4349 domain-containing protein [Anaerolineaceae bacterium]|nr:DUF4349 domain-containing protein [Anaerolineaceae bacterium]
MKKRNILLVTMILIVAIFASACAAAQSTAEDWVGYAPEAGYDNETLMMEESMEMDGMAAESSRSYDSGMGESAAATERMVIYNANLRIAVENPTTSLESIIAMAESAGGFVVYSNIYQSTTSSGSTVPYANVTIRVPAGQLDPIMTAIKGLTPEPEDDVLSENVSGQDVTSEYTDLESELRNLEAAEEALTAIMEKAQDTEDVLDVFDELTYYRGQIEAVKGRMQYLSESAALSAISVEIVAKESLQPITVAGWEPQGTIKKAVEALINAGQKLVDILIWFVISWLPFLAVFGAIIYFVVRGLKKGKAKRQAKKRKALEQTPENKPEG